MFRNYTLTHQEFKHSFFKESINTSKKFIDQSISEKSLTLGRIWTTFWMIFNTIRNSNNKFFGMRKEWIKLRILFNQLINIIESINQPASNLIRQYNSFIKLPSFIKHLYEERIILQSIFHPQEVQQSSRNSLKSVNLFPYSVILSILRPPTPSSPISSTMMRSIQRPVKWFLRIMRFWRLRRMVSSAFWRKTLIRTKKVRPFFKKSTWFTVASISSPTFTSSNLLTIP